MFLTIFERVLWVIAIVAITAAAWERSEAWLYQSYLNREFSSALAAGPPAAIVKVPTRPANQSVKRDGEPLGRLEIPAIDLSTIYLEGVATRTLRRGIGHIPGTVLPGESGNAGLSAHRDMFFRRFGEIRIGDLVRVVTLEGTFEYRVEAMQIVNPDESIVLRDVGRPVLTLVTCYPFGYIGPAPKRFVVHAGLITTTAGLGPRPRG